MVFGGENDEECMKHEENRAVWGPEPKGNGSPEVFDVLFYMDAEGQSYDLRQTPLKARLDFLAKIVVPREHWLECAAWRSMAFGSV